MWRGFVTPQLDAFWRIRIKLSYEAICKYDSGCSFVLRIQRHTPMVCIISVRDRPEWKNVKPDVEVEMGNPAEVILDMARKRNVAWFVISTHGRTGIKQWVYGSVADKVLCAADRTVALVRAELFDAGTLTDRK